MQTKCSTAHTFTKSISACVTRKEPENEEKKSDRWNTSLFTFVIQLSGKREWPIRIVCMFTTLLRCLLMKYMIFEHASYALLNIKRI